MLFLGYWEFWDIGSLGILGVGEIIAHFGELSLNVSRVKVVATDMCLNCLTRSQVGIFVYLCICVFIY